MKKLLILKNICKVSIVAAVTIGSLNAKGFEANVLVTTDKAYVLGGSYIFNENVKLGLGIISVDDLNTNANKKDDFLGGYATLELKKEVYPKTEVFLDLSYVSGKTDETNLSIDKAIAGVGVKYNDDKYLSPYIGITSEEVTYVGISKQLNEAWEVGIGAMHDFDYNDSSAFLTFSYNFGSGSSSNITTSVKSALNKEFNDKYKATPTPAPEVFAK